MGVLAAVEVTEVKEVVEESVMSCVAEYFLSSLSLLYLTQAMEFNNICKKTIYV